MTQPEGFTNEKDEHKVWKLKKSLYGLKQAPRCWNMTLDHHLKTMSFEQTSYVSSKGELFFIAVYVDDIILAGKSIERMNEVKSALSAQFDVKDLGDLHYFLGVT